MLGAQRWKCAHCAHNVTERTFSVAYRHRFTADQIRGAVALLLMTNASTRTAELLMEMLTATAVSHMTLWRWIHKFKNRLELVSKRYRKVQAGVVWHVDEVFIHVRGSTSKKNCSYLVIVRDSHGTILGVSVGHSRDESLISRALRQARSNAKKKPAITVSDGWKAYPPSLAATFEKSHARDSPKHVVAHFEPRRVQHRGRRYVLTNNPAERTNSSYREWEHGKRGFKSLATAQRAIEAWAAARNARCAGLEFWYAAFPQNLSQT